MYKAHLARLTYALAIRKPPSAKQLRALRDVVEEADVQQQARASSARPALPRIAMNDHQVLLVSCSK